MCITSAGYHATGEDWGTFGEGLLSSVRAVAQDVSCPPDGATGCWDPVPVLLGVTAAVNWLVNPLLCHIPQALRALAFVVGGDAWLPSPKCFGG